MIVHLGDAVDRHARAEDDAALVAHLHDFGQHRDAAMGGQAGRVDTELPQTGQPIEHDLADLDEIVAGRWLAAGNIGILDMLPQA